MYYNIKYSISIKIDSYIIFMLSIFYYPILKNTKIYYFMILFYYFIILLFNIV